MIRRAGATLPVCRSINTCAPPVESSQVVEAGTHPVSAVTWGALKGGLYGVQIGQVFFGESMFADVSDASKIAFVHAVGYLQQRGVKLIDCQMHTDHLARFGGKLIPYDDFRQQLYAYCPQMLTLTIEPTIIANTCPQYPPPF